ncbi:MAG: DHA2 family efflux MFS transporter permease subunit [Candidatus Eremiobacteraeota bacterium]|nr:DHA2 family efflux MFS transporter permease subunit [Candidatus Eremiobacteraeota bacterium]
MDVTQRSAVAAPDKRRDVTEHGICRLLIVIGVMAATLMQTLDTTITNVALPTIQGNLGASPDEGTWVVTAYTIAAIIVIPLTPWLQDRIGRKLYFCASIVGFTLASVACGTADSLTFLVTARVVQGAFGGGLLATAQAILRDTFPRQQLGTSQAIFALGAILGPALGPPLGGYLVDNYAWNWCFDINVVPGTLATILLFMLLRDPTSPRKSPVDVVGLILLASTLSTMQYVFTEGERNYWFASGTILTMTVVCIVSLAAFIWWELTMTDVPMVDLRVFKNRSVASGSVLALALGGVVFGSTYVIPQLTQGPLGFTPTLSGELFILRAVPILICAPFVPRLAARVDRRIILAVGFLLMAAGTLLQVNVTTYTADFWSFALPLIIVGVSSALLFVPISIAVLSATTPSEGPKAAAMINLATQLGGSIAIALLDVVVDRRWTFHSSVLGAATNSGEPAVHQFFGHGGSTIQLNGIVNTQAAVLAYADATVVMAVIALLCLPLVLLMRKPAATAVTASPT